jgi:hypothetical protein
MTDKDMLAEAVLASKELVTRYLAGFDDANRMKQAPGLPDHAAWTLGHCALTMHRVAEKLDDRALPESDFVTGDGREGDAKRYDTESVCFDSKPVDDAAIYPMIDRGREVFEAACDRLGAAASNAVQSKLDEEIQWGPAPIPLWRLVLRVSLHNGAHAGQLVDLRRGLGLERVIQA